MRMLLVAVLAALAGVAQAQAPGRYVTERGWGNLVVKPGKGGAMAFEINAIGGNMHICNLDGEIRGGRATLEGIDDRKPCIVTFKPGPQGVDVATVTEDACRQYCGARAHFTGMYLRPAKGCAGNEVEATRAAFKRHYDAKRYADARALLEPVLDGCAKTLGWIDEAWIRNDVAITQYRLGDRAACVKTLDPLAGDAGKTDAQLKDDYPPSDYDMYRRVVGATRANLKLCKSPAK